MRLSVSKIDETGGTPIQASGPSIPDKVLPGYDLPPEGVADKIIADWAAHEGGADFDRFWFGCKQRYGQKQPSVPATRAHGHDGESRPIWQTWRCNRTEYV